MDKLYDTFMAPLEKRWLTKLRFQLIAQASGQVLEIGFGTGANLRHYDQNSVRSLTTLDPEVQKTIPKPSGIEFRMVAGHAEKLPFDDGSFDTVVETLVLCSVSDIRTCLMEVRRVLRPGGRFIFLDHVLPENKALSVVFQGINVIWPHLVHGCNLNRRPHLLIEACGFSILESGTCANAVFRYGVAEKIPDSSA